MAKTYHAKVTFLYCYRLITTGSSSESLQMKKDKETSALAQFREIEKNIIVTDAVPYQFVAEVGFVASRIEHFIRKNPIELLVIGNSLIENLTEDKSLSFEDFLNTLKVPVIIATGINDFLEASVEEKARLER